MKTKIKSLIRQEVSTVVYTSLQLLTPRSRRILALLVIFNCLINLFELVSLYLVALIISLSLVTVTGKTPVTDKNALLQALPGSLTYAEKTFIAAAIFMVVFLAKTFGSSLLTRQTLRYLAKQSSKISQVLMNDLFQLSPSILRFGKSQEQLTATTGGVDALVIGLLGAISMVISDVVLLAVILFVLLTYNFATAISVCAILLLAGLIITKYSNRAVKFISEKLSILTVGISRKFLDTRSIYRELSLADLVDERVKEIGKSLEKAANFKARLTFTPQISKYILEITTILIAAIVACIEFILHDVNRALTSFGIVFAALTRIVPSVLRLSSNLLAIKQAEGSSYFTIKTIEEIRKSRMSFPKKVEPTTSEFSPRLDLKNVSFSYSNEDAFQIKNFSISIQEGEFIALVGKSGSGKSTLVDLMLGFLEPNSGEILISGVDARSSWSIWPGKISYVPQEIAIIDGTVEENIVLRRNAFNKSRLDNVLSVAAIDKDVASFENGINTKVGENGIRLSGGQRQRIGIARALYTQPSILVLDEATSALDSETEHAISSAILADNSNLTRIVIAHRLSTIKKANRILYLENGIIRYSGTFEELRARVPEFERQIHLSNL